MNSHSYLWRLMTVLVAAGTLALLAGCGARRSEQARVQGDTFLRLGQVANALKEYDRALGLNPSNALAHLGRGRALADQKKNAEALEAYQKAREADADLEPAYVFAVGILLSQQNTAEAEKLAQDLQSKNPEAGDILLANVQWDAGRTEDAIGTLEKRRDLSPQSSRVRIKLAKIYQESGQADKAEQELKDALSVAGMDTVTIRMALVDLYGRTPGRLEPMIEELRKLTDEQPEESGLKLALARALLESGEVDEAQKTAETVSTAWPDNPWANYIIGSCELARGKYEDAVSYLETAASALPDQPIVQQQLKLAREGGKSRPDEQKAPDETATAAQSPEPGTSPASPRPDGSWQSLWRSASLLQLVEGRNAFLSENPDNSNVRETLTLAALFTGQRNVADEIAKGLPEDSPLRAYLASLKSGDFGGAIKALEPWKSAEPSRRLLERNAYGFAVGLAGLRYQALLAFTEAGKDTPDNAVYLYNLAVMYRAARMPEFAVGALRNLQNRYPENMAARQLLFQVYLEMEDFANAAAIAESSYGLFPARREPILSLAQIYVLIGKSDSAIKALERGLEALPNDPALLLTLASVRLYQEKPAEARQIASAVNVDSTLSDARRRVMGFAYGQERDWAGLAKELTLNDSDPLSLRLLQAAALVGSGRAAEAVQPLMYQGKPLGLPKTAAVFLALGQSPDPVMPGAQELAKALQANPAAFATYLYALACVEGGFQQDAFKALGEVAQAVGDFPYLVGGQLTVLAKTPGLTDKAALAQAVVDRQPNMAEAWAGLAQVRQSLKDAEGAREALEKARSLDANSVDAWIQTAQFAEWQKDRDLAMEAYEHLTLLAPNDPSFHNNYAYYLMEMKGDIQLALREAVRAQEKLKSNPNVLHTLGRAQLEAGDIQTAHKNLRAAVEMRPGDPTLLLDYGMVLAAMDMKEEGKKQAEMALRTAQLLDLDFPREQDARELAEISASASAAAP